MSTFDEDDDIRRDESDAGHGLQPELAIYGRPFSTRRLARDHAKREGWKPASRIDGLTNLPRRGFGAQQIPNGDVVRLVEVRNGKVVVDSCTPADSRSRWAWVS